MTGGVARLTLRDEAVAAQHQPGRRAVEDVHSSGIGNSAEVFELHTDGQIAEAIAIEVIDGEAAAEPVLRLGLIGHRHTGLFGVLCPELRRRRQSVGGSGEDTHGSDVAEDRFVRGERILERGADRKVLQAVMVDVAGGQHGAELVTELGLIVGRRATLLLQRLHDGWIDPGRRHIDRLVLAQGHAGGREMKERPVQDIAH